MDHRREGHCQANRHPPSERRIRDASHSRQDHRQGVWFDTHDGEWYIDLQGVDGNLMQEAEVVEDVYGENEEELEKRANELLAAYGLKLGKFDEATGDRWELVEA
jgi:hypothetical protein